MDGNNDRMTDGLGNGKNGLVDLCAITCIGELGTRFRGVLG